MITVYGTSNNNRVALWDRDDEHPDGEVMVVNDGKAYEVAETAAVKRAISEGRLTTTAPRKPRGYGGRPPGLRKATDAEEDRAGLTGFVEKETAVVTEKKNG